MRLLLFVSKYRHSTFCVIQLFASFLIFIMYSPQATYIIDNKIWIAPLDILTSLNFSKSFKEKKEYSPFFIIHDTCVMVLKILENISEMCIMVCVATHRRIFPVEKTKMSHQSLFFCSSTCRRCSSQ